MHIIVLAILKIWGGKKTTKMSKIVSFGKFRKTQPPFPKSGLLEWGARKGASLSAMHKNFVFLLKAYFVYSVPVRHHNFTKMCASCTKTENLRKIVGRCAIPPPPFLTLPPLESLQGGGGIPPPHKRGISARLARYHMKTRRNGCDTLL